MKVAVLYALYADFAADTPVILLAPSAAPANCSPAYLDNPMVDICLPSLPSVIPNSPVLPTYSLIAVAEDALSLIPLSTPACLIQLLN